MLTNTTVQYLHQLPHNIRYQIVVSVVNISNYNYNKNSRQ